MVKIGVNVLIFFLFGDFIVNSAMELLTSLFNNQFFLFFDWTVKSTIPLLTSWLKPKIKYRNRIHSYVDPVESMGLIIMVGGLNSPLVASPLGIPRFDVSLTLLLSISLYSSLADEVESREALAVLRGPL